MTTMPDKTHTQSEAISAELAAAEELERLAHDRVVQLRACLRARVALDAATAKREAAITARVAAASKAT